MIVIRSMRLILAARRPAFFRASSCSQIRTTRQPARRNMYVTTLSRAWLAANLFRQKAALLRGLAACCGQPSQFAWPQSCFQAPFYNFLVVLCYA